MCACDAVCRSECILAIEFNYVPPYVDALHTGLARTDALVKNFAEKDAANYGHSPLPELMREMEKMPRK